MQILKAGILFVFLIFSGCNGEKGETKVTDEIDTGQVAVQRHKKTYSFITGHTTTQKEHREFSR